MIALNLALWILGLLVIAAGTLRARGPWSRYQALKAQQENVERYEAWRGGTRTRAAPSGPSGAEVAMGIELRRAQLGAAIVVVGILLFVVGFAVR